MADAGFAVFATPIGTCGIAWGPRGIAGVRLPEVRDDAMRERMAAKFPHLTEAGPSPEAQCAIDGIQALLAGESRTLEEVVLDVEGVPEFQRRVYDISRRIPPGRTRTYGDIALELGDKTLARAVGHALGQNPFAPVVPCHRVLAAGGMTGGFSAPGGTAAKIRMLMIEGARPESDTASLF